ncbi:flagellar hook-basal body protein [Halomonas fontilapidosi]|uniref:Flagellar hook protein FlgE n=1 Tax=Halomonas fontilapidosi TaxID=616675 RepID=A0A7W5DH80_9GAMM|nr:flagellar hook-basal body complex protein [Halomonas fontilapidosi]MBB3182877.1 flagellar hook-basal body protein [Halomonas fontilapidosi]
MGFSQALSGLNAAASSLDVQGNNIANSQTVGFKSSSAQFADVFANSKIGLGTRMSTVLQDFGEGNLESTGRELDLGISGEGFFRFMQNDQVVYSRNGQLSMTSDGYLQNAQGARIMGYGVNANGEVQTGGQPQVIQVGSEEMEASATSQVGTVFNLDSREVAGEDLDQARVVTDVSNPDNPVAQEQLDYHFSNNFTVYDSLGNPRNISIYYEKRPEAENSWLAKVAMDGYYDMTSDPVGKAAGEVSVPAKEAGDAANDSYDQLLRSANDVKSDLDSLKGALDAAAASANTAGATKEDISKAVMSAASQFITSSGTTLSEVLDKYLNGEDVGSGEGRVLSAFVESVEADIESAGDANAAKSAVDGSDPMTDGSVIAEFDAFLAARSKQIVESVNPQYAGVAQSAAEVILSGRAAGDAIDQQIVNANATDLDGDADTLASLQSLLSVLADDVLSGVDDNDVIDAVNGVEAAAQSATTLTAAVSNAVAADPGEAFEAFGTNDFVVEFDQNGSLSRVGQPRLAEGGGVEYVDARNNTPSVNFSSSEQTPLAGAPADLTFDIDLAGATQFGNTSRTTDLQQNGYTSGAFVGISIEGDGTVVRNYSNEQSVAAGQIAMASFRNPEGLSPEGDNAWSATQASGQELVGAPGTGLLGSIESGAIETSNVDMARELVDMIVTQRAYQANSQTIKTQDEVLQTAINLR